MGIVQKCLHGLMKGCLTTNFMQERAGAFSAVTGGRAPSLICLALRAPQSPQLRWVPGPTTSLWGKPLAPSECEENSGRGQNSPVEKWLEKTSPGALAASGGLGTEEKVPALSEWDLPMQTLLNVSNNLFIYPLQGRLSRLSF